MVSKMIKNLFKTSVFSFTALLLTGCFHKPTTPNDPYENFNRTMFALNMDLDHLIMRPVAKTYNFVTPRFVQGNVKNFFDNLDEVTSLPNDLMQGKMLFMLNDFWRVVLNSTAGLAGLFDVAKHIGLPPHYESFGLTIAYWEGNKYPSSYLVLPFIGPGNIRTAVGDIVDLPTTPYVYVPWDYWYIGFGVPLIEMVNTRARLLPANRMIDEAFDPYVFIRSVYTDHLDELTAENQKEKYGSKQILSYIKVGTEDYVKEAATEKTKTNPNPDDPKQQSNGLNKNNEEENGYIFDDEKKK